MLVTALPILCSCSPSGADYTITLGGDIMLSRGGFPLFHSGEEAGDPWGEIMNSPDFSQSETSPPDYFFANLESPFGEAPAEASMMNLCSSAEEVRVLLSGQLDLLSLANNHQLDCGPIGASETQAVLEVNHIRFAGPGMTPSYLETPTGKIAVVAAEDVSARVDIEGLIAQIKKARQESQVVVVSLHWGNEYQAGPDPAQEDLAQRLAGAGADLIWGHHPHVLQKMEWLKTPGGRETLVIYSLGNLLADQWMLQDAQRSVLVRISYKNSSILKIEILPLEIKRAGPGLVRIEDAQDLEGVYRRLKVAWLKNHGVLIQFPE